AVDHVAAVTQGEDAAGHTATHQVAGVGADEAVGGGDRAADPLRAAAPRHRPALAVPQRAADQVVAGAQGGDVAGGAAHALVGVGADEAVGGGDGAAGPGRAAAPGHRPAVAVPQRAADHVVAVAQGENAVVAHAVRVGRADQAVGVGDDATDPGGA